MSISKDVIECSLWGIAAQPFPQYSVDIDEQPIQLGYPTSLRSQLSKEFGTSTHLISNQYVIVNNRLTLGHPKSQFYRSVG